jgi:hypothetical protein
MTVGYNGSHLHYLPFIDILRLSSDKHANYQVREEEMPPTLLGINAIIINTLCMLLMAAFLAQKSAHTLLTRYCTLTL